jgi:hypothetical protein
MTYLILSDKSKHTLVYTLAFFIGIAVPALFAYSYAIPVPHIHDEFAYLLQADTFSHARLSNPTHPMYEFFETFHVFHTPTYQAKYPPGQGLFLALGEIVYALPAAGVWLSCGLACFALAWLLTACIPPLWALLTTLLFLLNPTVLVSWSQSYWGGYVAFIGGALFFGSLFRLMEKRKTSTSTIMVLAVFILSITRPVEGLLTVAIALPFLLWSWKDESIFKKEGWPLKNYATVLAFGVVAIIIFQLIYNNAVSGNPLKYAYLNWTYKNSNIDLIRNYTGSPKISIFTELSSAYKFFYTPFLGLILALLFFVKEKNIVILSILWIFIITIVSTIMTPAWPHYLAPIAPLNYLLVGIAFHTLSCKSMRGIKTGRLAAAGLYTAFIFYFISTLFIIVQSEPPYTWGRVRQEILTELNKTEEKNIIFVRYSKSHSIHSEWVYNEADIDRSQVIWARDLGAEKNKALIAHFPKRNIWLLEPDKQPVAIIRYMHH